MPETGGPNPTDNTLGEEPKHILENGKFTITPQSQTRAIILLVIDRLTGGDMSPQEAARIAEILSERKSSNITDGL